MAERVHRRSVLHVHGYEPLRAASRYRRIGRELKIFEKTWDVSATLSDLDEEEAKATTRIATTGPGWRVDTDFTLLSWDDFVRHDFDRPWWKSTIGGIVALGDFIISGTVFRYFAVAWRYGLFFLWPIVLMGVLGAVSAAAGWATHRLAGLPVALAALAGFGVSALLLRFAAGPLYLRYLLDDWRFARDVVRRRRRALDRRLDAFAEAIVVQAQDSGLDEIIISGHSLGAAFAIVALDRALTLDPDLGRRGTAVSLLTTGSSLLKVGLHPAAGWLRAAVERVSQAPDIGWTEYQTLVDPINFYKTDPVAALGLPPAGRPRVIIIRLRHMLSPASYRAMRGRFFKLHRRFVLANEKRYHYDFFMICCGPLPFARRSADPHAAEGAFAPGGVFGPPLPNGGSSETAPSPAYASAPR